MSPALNLKASDGSIVTGVRIAEHRFSGRMKAAQLLKIADDPRRTEDLRQRQGNTQLEDYYRLRAEVQRAFEGAKRANVESYTRYLVNLHGGADGTTPAIILFSESALPVEESDDGTGFLLIPWDQHLVAIDGETQLAARFEAANVNPTTKQDFVAVEICHGRSLDWARQSFHDLNRLGVRPNAAIGIGMDQRDPLTHITRRVEQRVPLLHPPR